MVFSRKVHYQRPSLTLEFSLLGKRFEEPVKTVVMTVGGKGDALGRIRFT